MASLDEAVLGLIRTRTALYYSAATAHGAQMHRGVDILEETFGTGSHDPMEVHRVTHKALTSAVKVVARADDSAGIIGDACRRLLDLHPRTAAAAKPPASRLVAWMIKFQFDGDVDYFTLDPVAYAPALGEKGIAAYRAQLTETATRLGLDPQAEHGDLLGQRYRHEQFVLGWNSRRLAVHDRDVDAIIRTHARDQRVAAWLTDTAQALAEIGEIDLAIDWARRGAEHAPSHQAAQAAEYWCQLLQTHRPDELLDARRWVFDQWPTSTTAARLHHAAGQLWPHHAEAVKARLADRPRDAVLFVHTTLTDVPAAWQLAHDLNLGDTDVWEQLVAAYQHTDPIAVLPVLRDLVERELANAGAVHYKRAARRLKTMRRLTTDHPERAGVDAFIAELRHTHHRRPRLQQEFTRAQLP